MDRWTDRQTNKHAGRISNEQMDKQAKRQTDTQTVIHIHEQKNIEQVDGQTVGWTYRQIEKWTDIETHEQYFMKY
jgi:hypothetical protein